MSFTDETVRFEFGDSDKKEIGETLVDVYNVLEAKGYNPINQIVGYVLSETLLISLVMMMRVIKFAVLTEMILLRN